MLTFASDKELHFAVSKALDTLGKSKLVVTPDAEVNPGDTEVAILYGYRNANDWTIQYRGRHFTSDGVTSQRDLEDRLRSLISGTTEV